MHHRKLTRSEKLNCARIWTKDQIATARKSVAERDRIADLDLSKHFYAMQKATHSFCSSDFPELLAINPNLQFRWNGLQQILTAYNLDSHVYQIVTYTYDFEDAGYRYSSNTMLPTLRALLELADEPGYQWPKLTRQQLDWIVWSTPPVGKTTEISEYFAAPHPLSLENYFEYAYTVPAIWAECLLLEKDMEANPPRLQGKVPNQAPSITFMGTTLFMPNAVSYAQGRERIKTYLQKCGCNTIQQHRICKAQRK